MKSFDYIVVGAGSSGCVVASRLSEDKDVKVLVLEAGPAKGNWKMRMPLAWQATFQDPKVGWGFQSEPEPHADGRRIPAPRGKVLGGSSSVNGMMYSRGHARDYDQWRQLGLTGWGYADILPYFKRSERNWRGGSTYHGDSGPLTVSKHHTDAIVYPALIAAAEKRGYKHLDDFHGAEMEGWSTPDFTTHNGIRGSTYERFLKPAMARPNLTVVTEALTHRVLVEQGRAVGVEYSQGGTVHQVRAEREVILSGGAFNSPQLLMLSGIGPADDLRAAGVTPIHDLPGVGQNLQDHHSTGVMFKASGKFTMDSELRLDRILMSVARWKLFGTGFAADLPVGAMGFYRTRPELERPDIQALVSPISMMARIWFPGWRQGRGHVFSCANVLLRPESRGHVGLRSADPKDSPKIHFNLLASPNDRASFRAAIRWMREFFATEPAAKLVSAEMLPGAAVQTDDELDAYVRKFCGTAFHPVGTCAMGINADAVVDETLKVRGLDGLRVVDASVMPQIIGGNTNAPAIMIAEKAADMIRGRPPLPAEPGLEAA